MYGGGGELPLCHGISTRRPLLPAVGSWRGTGTGRKNDGDGDGRDSYGRCCTKSKDSIGHVLQSKILLQLTALSYVMLLFNKKRRKQDGCSIVCYI